MTEIIAKSLSHRVVKGGFWVFALRITERIFYLTRLIILARILAPHDFGLLGIAMLTMLTLENFSQTGFQAALIQKKENIDEYLNTAWTVGIIRGIILFITLYFIAPYVAIFFKTPQAESIIRVIGFSILINAFTNIGVIYFQKELEFNKQFIYQLTGTLADFVVAVSAALLLRSVWALVFGLLAGNAARLVASYFIHQYRPHINFDIGRAKELLGFGKWVLGSSILVFVITQGDDIFVGKLLGVTMLGFYQMAYKISNTPATEITHVISQITFPAYSKLQDNMPILREAFLKVLQLTAFLSFPIAGLIFVLAPDFTKLFLGQKWMPMVPAMQVLVFWGIIRSIGATVGPVFYGMGKPEINTKLQFIQLILLAILIYPLSIRWGILGVSLAVVFAALIANLGSVYMVIKITKCGAHNFYKMIALPLISLAIMVLSTSILRKYWLDIGGISQFFLYGIICISIYPCIAYFFDRFFSYGMEYPLKKALSLFKNRWNDGHQKFL
jgi:O-antigen/teichoic acid export membrane protein